MLILRQPRIFDVDLLGPVLAIALALGLWLGMIQPLESRIAREQEDRQTIDQQKTDAQAQLEQMRQQGEALSVLATLVQHHQDILQRNLGEDQVISRLDDLFARHQLQWNTLTPTGHYEHPCFYRWDVQLSLTGSSPSVAAFISDLRQEMPYCKTRELSITHQDHLDANKCNISIKFDIFSPPYGG
ncbi:MAG: hypothetical protein JW709_07765 [Sedimentisphaerales bacterium]|nr:hypothetical protein [Sedimentisphaerales bacterium]